MGRTPLRGEHCSCFVLYVKAERPSLLTAPAENGQIRRPTRGDPSQPPYIGAILAGRTERARFGEPGARKNPTFESPQPHEIQPARPHRPVRLGNLPGRYDLRREDSGIWKAIGALGQGEVDAIVGKSIAGGVNFFDTADVYSYGQSERLLGQAFKNLGTARKDVVIATKVFGEMGPGPNDKGASRGHIMDSVSGSLERLQTDHIDLYQIHGTDTVTPIDETLRALDDLVRQGMVRYIGVSNWAAWKIAKALGAARRRAMPASRPCRPTIPSPAATWSANWSRC